ncbi:MAG: HAMP domain-containing sensor histidine kinase [Myxococcota bacterium]
MLNLFEELKRYVGFTDADGRRLRALKAPLEPHFPAIAEAFYARILEHEHARAALGRGEKHVGQLKVTLVKWMSELFDGPWDEAYVNRRARIGRVHVQIALPQHYMISAMNVVRLQLRERMSAFLDEASPEGRLARDAVERVLDLDLAIMLHTYREDLEAAQQRAERLATYGQLIGSIGHELRNPLGVIETSLYVLKGVAGDNEKAKKHLDRIGTQVTLANDIITQLLDLIRDRPLVKQRIDLGAVARDALSGLEPPATIALQLTGFGAPCPIDGDPTQLRQVVVNLVENALDAVSPAGRITVTLEVDGPQARLVVDDSGPGIDPSVRNRLFEPLVTTKPRGIGLGLALVRRVVERHGGTVAASRAPLGGARFTLTLPRAEGQP